VRIAGLLMCTLLMVKGVCYASDRVVLKDSLDGKTSGKAVGVTFSPGKNGQAAVFNAPDNSIEYPATAFATWWGRIEFDMKLTEPLSAGHTAWCLLSDVGSGGAYRGAINCQWPAGSQLLEYGIFDGTTWHWCRSNGVDWKPGVWYHVGLSYGSEGMRLDVDNKAVDSNDYRGKLAVGPKKLGMHDSVFSTPPVMIDDFVSYRMPYDLKVSNYLVLPVKDGWLDDVTINYEVETACTARMDVLDTSGALVAKLVDERKLPQGEQNLSWDGGGLPDGEYIIRLAAKSPSGSKELREAIQIDNRWRWKKAGNPFKNFFAKGTFFFCESDSWYNKTHIDDPTAAKSYYERTMKDLAEHGFNLVNPYWTPVDHRQMMLDAAQKHGIKVIVHLQEINSWIWSDSRANIFDLSEDVIKDVRHHPAVVGYYIVDEPAANANVIQRAVFAKRALETIDPKHPSFSCLIGGYEEILDTVDYQVMLIDVYPLVLGWSGDFSGYIGELERAKKNVGNRQFWMTPQVFGKPKVWKIPTPEEIRAQAWLALAYGAKGFMHFIYQSTTSIQGESLQGLVDMNLNQMDGRLDELEQFNADLDKLSPTLLSLRPAEFATPEVPEPVVIKAFTGNKNGRYVILVNKDTKNEVVFDWTGAANDVLTGEKIGSQILLGPGGGKVLKLR